MEAPIQMQDMTFAQGIDLYILTRILLWSQAKLGILRDVEFLK